MTELVDLTLPLSNGMPMVKPWPSPVVLTYVTHAQAQADGLGDADDPFTYSATFLATLDHAATHVDAPSHYDPAGISIDNCPLEWFVGRAICLDLSHIPDLGDIDAADLEAAEAHSETTIDGHIVLLYTGFHDRHFPRESVLTHNPGLTAAATHWLADRGVSAHGVEGPSTDKAGTSGFPSHRACRDRGIVHYEWLVNLGLVVGRGEFDFSGYPLKLEGATGSPVRAVARLG
jgi:kynurenine formamidase